MADEHTGETWFDDTIAEKEHDCFTEVEAWVAQAWEKDYTPEEINKKIHPPIGVDSVRFIIRKYEQYLKLFGKEKNRGRPRALTWPSYRFLLRLLKYQPYQCGYRETKWTKALILDCLRRWDGIIISENTLTRILHKAGYQWINESWQRLPGYNSTAAEGSFPGNIDMAAGCYNSALMKEDIKRINEIPPSA